MAGTGDDVINRLASLATNRLDYEWAWKQVARVAAPDAGDFSTRISGASVSSGKFLMATAARRSKDIYDSTAVTAVDRLASGLEALIIPQSEYWHSFEILSLSREEATYREKLWMQRLRNLVFKVRYDADSGWIAGSQTCFRRLVAFGNAFMWVEDGVGRKSLVRYRYIPLDECFVDEDHLGQIDTFYRDYSLTARQAVQKFGNKASEIIQKCAENPKEQDRRFGFVQCVQPRGDFGLPSEGVMRTPWASLHVEVESRRVVRESGFFEFPVVDFRWLPEPGRIYGEGPVMKCLADIQSLNLMAKNELTASQQAIDPPLLVANAGVMNRPNSNPGAINYGGMSPTGQELVKPMFTGQRLDFATLVLEAKRNQVKESMYINLFALLVQNPQMTATEALIRANEKGELLGPAGSRIQQGLSHLVDRELDILARRGLYAPGSAFVPPTRLQGLEIGPQFTGPLSRLRQTKEVEGTIRTLQVMAPLAQIKPEVVDNFDEDRMARGLGERLGMPIDFLRPFEAVQQIRQVRSNQQAFAQAAAIAKDASSAGKQSSEALVNIQQMGL
jgi:hypothetical protein